MWHPASLLILWVGFAVLLQRATLPALSILLVATLFLTALFAARRARNLLWRSRWLLLSLGILFLFFTPGEYLPGLAGDVGMTREGMVYAGEHLGRLIAMLAALALLHERIGTPGLLSGLYWLLGPFRGRDATVVRLMLVLDNVESAGRAGWRDWLIPDGAPADAEAGSFALAMPPLRLRDMILIGGLCIAALMLVFWP